MDIKFLTVEGALAIINDPNNTFGIDKEELKRLMSEAIKDEMRGMQRVYRARDGFDKSAYNEADEELWSDEYDVNSELYEEDSSVDTEETDLFAKYYGKGR